MIIQKRKLVELSIRFPNYQEYATWLNYVSKNNLRSIRPIVPAAQNLDGEFYMCYLYTEDVAALIVQYFK